MVLLWLMLLPTAFGADFNSQKNYTIRHVDSCPVEGYFVQRELAPNSWGPGPCFLCFCQLDGTATCWRREDWRCDVEKYHHHHVGKRDARTRRMAGLGDIFFRDATRDVFNKNIPQQCKPFESSFSDGCPPVDWCIGCTVCDCDANGHWDCHILSFCDKTTKKPPKKPARKGNPNNRRTVIRRPTVKPKITATFKSTVKKAAKPASKPDSKATSKPTSKTAAKLSVKPAAKPNVKPVAKPQPKVVKKVVKTPTSFNTRTKRQQQQKTVHKTKSKKINRNNPQKIIRKRAPPKKIIKKDVSKKPVDVTDKDQIVLPTTPKFTQAVIKKVLTAVQHLMRRDVKKGNTSKILQAVDNTRLERKKQDNNALLKRFSSIISRGSKKINVNTNKNEKKNPARNKRDVSDVDSLKVISVVPVDKGDTFPNNIIPIKKAETTTEGTTSTTIDLNIHNVTSAIESSITTPPTVDVLLYNDTTEKQTAGIIETESSTSVEIVLPIATTMSHNISDPTTITSTNTTTSTTSSTATTGNTINTVAENITTENVTSLSDSTKKINDIKNVTEATLIYLSENMTEANDLKFDNWAQIKLLKERQKNLTTEELKRKDYYNINKFSNNSFPVSKSNIHTQNITRKIDIPKKNKMWKIIVSNTMKKDSKNASTLDKKVSNLQNIFNNVLKEVNANTTKVNSGNKKFNIIKYMKKLFGKLLRIGKSNKTRTHSELYLDKQHALNMLCENIGSCKVNPKDSSILDTKLTQLNIETNKILKIIKIIKGLLPLVDIPVDDQAGNDILKPESYANNDVNKLNVILRGSYFNNLKSTSLTETQATQIEYIRRNTQDFIYSVAKFAKILNEIIAILKESNKSVKKRKIRLQDSKFSNTEAFRRLKHLLIRYDVMQNSLFKKIYNSLTNFETKLNNEAPKQNRLDEELKNMATIDRFSRNIVTNLRKLTQLAQSMNSRSKREITKDNDAVEYLLMLMEFLLKQNHALDVAPANDGIDLLIEAIKNAPNIKPIKKKVLQYIPSTFPTRTVPVKVKTTTQKKKARTTTVNKELKVTSRLDNPKFVEAVEEDRDYDDKYLYTRRAINNMDAEARYVEASTVSTKNNYYESIKDSVSEGISESKVDKHEPSDGADEKFAISDNKMGKHSKESGEKRFDIFNDDLNDIFMYITPSPRTQNYVKDHTEADTTTEPTTTPFETTIYDKKKLEWINDTFDKYVTTVKQVTEERRQETTTQRPPLTRTKKATSKLEENVSAVSKEMTTADAKPNTTANNKETTNSEQVIYKKQMDLLNSLDYVTEKPEFDIESKEVEEAFPTYFV